jgi:hypothetical protein
MEHMDSCYEKPKKFMSEVPQPVTEFRKYKISVNAAIGKFCALLRAAIKEARSVGHLKLPINKQALRSIIGKMPIEDRSSG